MFGRRWVDLDGDGHAERIENRVVLNQIIFRERMIADREDADPRGAHRALDGIALDHHPLRMVDLELEIFNEIVGDANVLTHRYALAENKGIPIGFPERFR